MRYSIIIPSYNTAATLETSVRSVLSCGLQDSEILLIDDGSKDETPAVCDRLAVEHSNIRSFHQPNSGVSSARNRGIMEARGDYIWFFDSDDLVDPGSMIPVDRIIETEAPEMLIFGLSFDYYNGKWMYQRNELYSDCQGLMSPDQLEASFSDLYRNNLLTPCWNKLIRRSVLLENQVYFDPALFSMEDFQFSLHAIQHCQQFYVLPDVIYRFVQQDRRSKKRFARDNKRMARIDDIALYLKAFEPFLMNHPNILTELFFSMLNEKLSCKSIEEMSPIAARFLAGPYYSGPYAAYRTGSQKWLSAQLRDGKFQELYQHYRKIERKRAFTRFVKHRALYRLLKGSTPRRGL